MRQTYFDQIPLEEALKRVARSKKSSYPIRLDTLAPSRQIVQQTKEHIAKTIRLQKTYNELERTFDELRREFRHRRMSRA